MDGVIRGLRTKGKLGLWRLRDRFLPPNGLDYQRARLIRRLNNHDFVKEATRIARSTLGSHPSFSTSHDSLFVCTDGYQHCFAHKARVSRYINGLDVRGEVLASDYLLDHVPFAPGDSVVDVGANVGDLVLALKSLDARVDMIALEPSPREFAALKINLTMSESILSNKVLNAAAWNESAENLVFYVKSNSADSSVFPITGYEERIEVPSIRLDSVLARKTYKLLKLEAEGAEPEILIGAEGVLDCFEYITVDVGFERGLKQSSTLPEVVNHLCARGFRIVAVATGRLVLLFKREAS